MPTYGYLCRSCKHEFTDIRSMAERQVPETLPCPECHQLSIGQKIGAPAVCQPHRITGTSSSQVGGDFKERMKQIKTNFKKDKHANIPDF